MHANNHSTFTASAPHAHAHAHPPPPPLLASSAGWVQSQRPQHPHPLLQPPPPPQLPRSVSSASSSWDVVSPAIVRVRSSASIDAVIISCAPSPSKWIAIDDDEAHALRLDLSADCDPLADPLFADFATITPLTPRQFEVLSRSATPVMGSRSRSTPAEEVVAAAAAALPESALPVEEPDAAAAGAAAGSSAPPPSAASYFLLRGKGGIGGSSLLLRTQLPANSVGSAAVMHTMRRLAHALKSVKRVTNSLGEVAASEPLAPAALPPRDDASRRGLLQLSSAAPYCGDDTPASLGRIWLRLVPDAALEAHADVLGTLGLARRNSL